MSFQRFAQIVEVFDLLDGVSTQVSAAARLDAYESFAFQTIQGLAHRRLADAQLAGEELFGKPATVVEVTFPDVLADGLVGKCS